MSRKPIWTLGVLAALAGGPIASSAPNSVNVFIDVEACAVREVGYGVERAPGATPAVQWLGKAMTAGGFNPVCEVRIKEKVFEKDFKGCAMTGVGLETYRKGPTGFCSFKHYEEDQDYVFEFYKNQQISCNFTCEHR